MLSLKEFLDRPLPNVIQGVSTTGTETTLPSNPRVDKITFRHWDNFKQDRDSGINKLAEENASLTFSEPEEVALMPVRSEDAIRSAFFETINPRIKRVFRALYGTYYSFMPHEDIFLLDPDLALADHGDPSKPLFPVELKTFWAFPANSLTSLVGPFLEDQAAILDNTGSSKHGSTSKEYRAVAQIYGYMSVNHMKYGLLSTYRFSFFFRRMDREDGVSVLEVSPPIPTSELM
ncbi:hypothetical protein MP638_002376, partial [Amoeboaphelidium occidentale]